MKTIIIFATLFVVVFTAAVPRGDQAPEDVDLEEEYGITPDVDGKINIFKYFQKSLVIFVHYSIESYKQNSYLMLYQSVSQVNQFYLQIQIIFILQSLKVKYKLWRKNPTK